MGLFHERTETAGKIILRFSYWPLLYIVLGVAFGAGLFAGKWAVWTWGVAIAFIVVFVIDMWKPSRELKRAMTTGRVSVSGNKYSFSNPLTAVITKQAAGESA